MKKIKLVVLLLIGLVNIGVLKADIIEEFNGTSLGSEHGVTIVRTPRGQGIKFKRQSESRIEYKFSSQIPEEGTLEFFIKVDKGYNYSKSTLKENNNSALIFTTDIQGGDVTWPGSTWLYVYKDGKIKFHIAGEKFESGWKKKYSLIAKNTNFKFGRWHRIGISYGSKGRYIKLDGKLVAGNPSLRQKLGRGGTRSNPVDLPTIGESVSSVWRNNQHEGGFEGILDTFRASKSQQNWMISNKNFNVSSEISRDGIVTKVFNGRPVTRAMAKVSSNTRHSHNGRSHNHPLPSQGVHHRHGNGAYGISSSGNDIARISHSSTESRPSVNAHSHGGRIHNHPLPKRGVKHRHGNGAYGFATNGNNNSLKNTSKPAIKHKKINNIQFASAFSEKLGKCKFQFPYSFLSDSRVFNIPINREDIVGVEFDVNGRGDSKCINGLLNDSSSRHDFAVIVNYNYLKKLGISDKKWGNNNLIIHFGVRNKNDLPSFTIFKNGIMTNANAFLMGFQVGDVNDIGMEHIDNNKKYMKKILTKSYYAKHSSSKGYKMFSGHFFGENGTNNYYLSSQEKAVATLSTSNPLKKYFDLKVKLIAGSKKHDILGSQFLVASKFESNLTKAYLKYTIKGNSPSLKGGYKVKVVVDLTFKYGIYTNIGGRSEKEHFYKELDIILTKENNWIISSQLQLPDIETSYSGKVIFIRVSKKFKGIDSRIYIKSIEEI